jgi:hypothetical protein
MALAAAEHGHGVAGAGLLEQLLDLKLHPAEPPAM